MELVIRAAGVAVTGAVLALALKKNAPETAVLLGAALGCLLLYMAVQVLDTVLAFVRAVSEGAGISSAALGTVLKTAAIAIVTKLGGDVCRDAGQTAAASALELAGCAAAVYVTIPLMESVLDMVRIYV